MTQKDTIILVADVRNWAFDNIARHVKSLLDSKYECHVIYSKDFKHYNDFIQSLGQYKSISLIHFFYRGYLTELLEGLSTNSSSAVNIDEFLSTAMTLSIPDHLFINNESEILNNMPIFQFVDNYYTTSRKLYEHYKNISAYPSPWGVIYDNILIDYSNFELADKLKASSYDELAIAWLGDSSWGRWYDNDYKGLNTIIKPAFKQLENAGVKIKKYIIDKNDHIYSKQEIGDLLKRTDILLIASIEEGTPLPLIEAMAFGCAIISTNVGIVREVLPTIQHEFIINRQPVEFFAAIKKLNNQRELLATVKEQNFIAYQKIFGDNTYLQNLWFNFIDESINNNATKHKLRIRHQVLHTITDVDPSFVNKGLQKILRVSWIKEIAKYFLKYCGVQEGVKLIISVYLYFFSSSEYKNFQKFIRQYQSRQVSGQERNVYVLYTELFPGVANSTKKLFNNTIPFPAGSLPKLFRRINSYLPEKIITQVAKLIIDSDIKKLIISGGVKVHVRLVEKLHEMKRDKSLEVYLLWHGSPAQWVDIGHCHDFYKWLTLYRQNKIQGIITLKKGLEEFLKSNSIPSYLLQNFIPNASLG